ncbi:uncharacterized protein [Epargyreus clarus]|uniref:uncharacterized protein isoform X2 n=1 Tax=Epargyreus clarus TaxID=520877 RepID=UPI003C2C2830
MAWPMPTTGQWTPGIAVTPDVNMGSYTPEQWAAMQQQNWQQWAQWQQQYATWQTQYGSKYAEQMQVLQSMNAMPPLPPASTAPPPAPPPPDKPPPPPHENDQPLYGHTKQLPQQQSIPVLAPVQNNAPSNNNTDTRTGNNQNRSYATDVRPEAALSAVNTEALKSLAEEEKAFDIQFQKWEEEIDKWKKANVNHPDRKAYEEYEERFESCRARLLERRQQMKQRRAKLMDTTQQPPISAPRHNIPTNTPSQHPPVQNAHSDNFNTTKEQSNHSFPSQNYNKNYSHNPQYNNMSQQDYYRENNSSFDPQDRHESYSNTSNNYSNHLLVSTEPFLPTTEPSKGIPGLDLVPEAEKLANRAYDVIDITEEPVVEKQIRNAQQGPDYSKISKGINNILGDEKIMNILSMVRGQNQPSNNNHGSYGTNTGGIPPNSWNRDESYNDNYGMNQNNMAYMKQQHNDYSMNQDNNQQAKYVAPPPKPHDERRDAMQQDQFYERNQQYQGHGQGQGLLPRPPMQQAIRPNAPMRSLLDPIQPNEYPNRIEFDRRAMQSEPHPPPNQGLRQAMPVRPMKPVRPAWVDEPLFTPSIIVEYEHKPLRLKARDFIEPVHTFDYNHLSKDGEGKKSDFEKEVDNLFVRKPHTIFVKEERYTSDRYSRDLYYRDHERSSNRDQLRDTRDEQYPRGPRDDDRRRYDDDIRDRRYDDRRRDDRDKYIRREDLQRERDRDRDDMYRDRNREKDFERNRDRDRDSERNKDRDRGLDQNRDMDRDAYRDRDRHRDYRRSKSHDKDSRKRGHSKDSDLNSSSSKKTKDTTPIRPIENPKHIVMIDDILELPGRQMRPEKIVIILRGPPGSGKSYLAKLIRDREAEHGGTVRVMSIDDYFMQEGEIEEKDPVTGKIVKKPSLKYEYDENLEETYMSSLKRAFKRSLTDGFFTFLIFDAVNDQLRSYADIWNFARQNNFQVYICTMELDPHACFKRNIHNRKLDDIEVICSRFFPTPSHHIQLDPTTLLQSASIPEVQMEDADDDVTMEDAQEPEVNNSFTSKWEKMDDAAQLARLDGTSKPLRPSQLSMEDYLQLDDWKPNVSKPGKKTVFHGASHSGKITIYLLS